MRQIFIKSLICFLVLSSCVLAAIDNKSSKNTNHSDSLVLLQQQIESLQNEIQQLDIERESSATLQTYDSAVDAEDTTTSIKNKLSRYRIDLMKNISEDGNIINLGDIEKQGIYGSVGGGIDVSDAAPITTRGEITYLGSYSGNNNIPIGMLPGSLFASTLMMQKEKFDDYSIFLGGFLGMDAQTWFGNDISRVDFSGNPTTPFQGNGQNMYLMSSRLYFVSNLGDYVTAEYDVSTTQLSQFFIGNVFVIFGDITASPFFVTAGRSSLSVSSFGGGGSSTGSIASFLGTGRATNVSLNYKSDTINTNISIFGTNDQRVDFSAGLFYADSWTEDLSIGFNTGYVYDLSGAENFNILMATGVSDHIGAYNIDANIAYNVGRGILQGNGGWATTTNADDFAGTGQQVLAGAWYMGLNYSLNLGGRNTNFNVGYGQSYNANAIPMPIAASLLQDGFSQTGIKKQLIFSGQRAYFDNYVLFGPEWAYQEFYDGTHMNTLTLDLSVYL
jgi:hypothetical protein